MKDEVKEHTHEQRRGMESPTGVPNPPPKESVEQVRARMNIAWRMRASRKNSGKLLGSSSLNTTPPTATPFYRRQSRHRKLRRRTIKSLAINLEKCKRTSTVNRLRRELFLAIKQPQTTLSRSIMA